MEKDPHAAPEQEAKASFNEADSKNPTEAEVKNDDPNEANEKNDNAEDGHPTKATLKNDLPAEADVKKTDSSFIDNDGNKITAHDIMNGYYKDGDGKKVTHIPMPPAPKNEKIKLIKYATLANDWIMCLANTYHCKKEEKFDPILDIEEYAVVYYNPTLQAYSLQTPLKCLYETTSKDSHIAHMTMDDEYMGPNAFLFVDKEEFDEPFVELEVWQSNTPITKIEGVEGEVGGRSITVDQFYEAQRRYNKVEKLMQEELDRYRDYFHMARSRLLENLSLQELQCIKSNARQLQEWQRAYANMKLAYEEQKDKADEALKEIRNEQDKVNNLECDMSDLQKELDSTKKEFETTKEALETTKEALETTKEALDAKTTELQTTKEKLQATKEELKATTTKYQTLLGHIRNATAEKKRVGGGSA